MILGESVWKKLFYRLVDSLVSSVSDRLRSIEELMFKSTIKLEIEMKMGEWIGSCEQNKYADMKIAVEVRDSLNNYEKSKESYEESYFSF